MASGHEHDIISALRGVDDQVRALPEGAGKAAISEEFERLIRALGDAGYCIRRGNELAA